MATRTVVAHCPACSNGSAVPLATTVYRCAKCRAIFGSCYKGDSYDYVKPVWHDGETAHEDLQFVSLEILGSAGIENFHGWVHKDTRRIVQVG
jgi:predicted RNA-binding Zn-ribbon protein involved in translation (DUF1610 family)